MASNYCRYCERYDRLCDHYAPCRCVVCLSCECAQPGHLPCWLPQPGEDGYVSDDAWSEDSEVSNGYRSDANLPHVWNDGPYDADDDGEYGDDNANDDCSGCPPPHCPGCDPRALRGMRIPPLIMAQAPPPEPGSDSDGVLPPPGGAPPAPPPPLAAHPRGHRKRYRSDSEDGAPEEPADEEPDSDSDREPPPWGAPPAPILPLPAHLLGVEDFGKEHSSDSEGDGKQRESVEEDPPPELVDDSTDFDSDFPNIMEDYFPTPTLISQISWIHLLTPTTQFRKPL